MKITSVEAIFVDKYLIARVKTSDGYVGIGESGAWGHLEASAAAILKCGEYLRGKDAFAIEHHWNALQRASHFTGAAIMGAVSAIDIALWDIKGQALGVPVFELLGGAVRNKVRVYAHVKAKTPQKMVEEALLKKRQGFTALGHLNPFLDEDYDSYFKPHSQKIDDAVALVAALRESLGPTVDLCIELHRRLTVAEAVTFARKVEPFNPMFIEDPLKPSAVDAMAWVADHVPVPIATGERYFSLHQFQTLAARRGVQFLRPSIGLCGGITGAKKIAALGEAYDMDIIPHNPLSPLNLAAELQLVGAVPNVALQEYPMLSSALHGSTELPGEEIFAGLPKPSAGFISIPTAPGLGIQLAENALHAFPKVDRPISIRPHEDGSFVDQ
ncbi:mandelate racemase/muconate lactonizing enzyme family protein [Rhizobium mayense]|uniref:Mandelate racemase/muconate lactonizing enzyme family protein n=1 Tax=Rhizobium mayense TaxID=1312184 RepID=A0ABT7JRG6_9HYPH|nr:mandelate racemase/muconate lactonizing enzyme family protein [Rhizobium mayense]MDL2398939.1 mandelate racemase/muconate lactonizing enzyme family protein [Rhizobium mayense]